MVRHCLQVGEYLGAAGHVEVEWDGAFVVAVGKFGILQHRSITE